MTDTFQDERLRMERELPPRLAISSRNRLVLVDVEEIDWIEANDNYLTVRRGGDTFQMRGPLGSLEHRLALHGFIRISRSFLLNLERVRELQAVCCGRYRVVLRNGEELTMTRRYAKRAKQVLRALL